MWSQLAAPAISGLINPVEAVRGIPGVLAKAAQQYLQWYNRARPTIAQIREELTDDVVWYTLRDLSMSFFNKSLPDCSGARHSRSARVLGSKYLELMLRLDFIVMYQVKDAHLFLEGQVPGDDVSLYVQFARVYIGSLLTELPFSFKGNGGGGR